MFTYIVRRIVINVPVLLGITILVFLMINAAPGDPATFFVNPEMGGSAEQLANIRHQFGLDQPLPVRYVKWLGQTVQGDLGYRIINGDRISTLIWQRLKATGILVGLALALGVTLGMLLGVFTAVKKYSFWDYLLTGLSFVGISMPAFVVGILGLYLLALKIPIFPAGGMGTVGQDATLGDGLYHAALPALLLSLYYVATFMRYTRFSVLDVLGQDFVRTARAKGLQEKRVLSVHVLRNGLLPVITMIGLSLPNLVVGALFMETIFSWPGTGRLYLEAVQSRDYPLLMGLNLVTATVILLCNLATDVAYAFVDPRVRYS
jgi:peptide/nickel transport system permease protein